MNFKIIMYRDSELEKDFYAQMCRLERWSVRTLQSKIDSMLFERTAISKKPAELAKLELTKLREEDQLSPDLVFRDHYVLDFLGLKDTYSEKDLEAAILSELEKFILELGVGFAFVTRRKRMVSFRTSFSEVVLLSQLRPALVRINPFLTDRFLDFEHPANNTFTAISQFKVSIPSARTA